MLGKGAGNAAHPDGQGSPALRFWMKFNLPVILIWGKNHQLVL